LHQQHLEILGHLEHLGILVLQQLLELPEDLVNLVLRLTPLNPWLRWHLEILEHPWLLELQSDLECPVLLGILAHLEPLEPR
jgi:hypothetical protein